MKRLAFASLVIALLAGCASDPTEPATAGHDRPATPEAQVIPGVFRIKLREGTGELHPGPFTRSGAGITSIDAAATRAGATEIRNLFSDTERFRERHRKAGLHLWYEVRFGGDVPVAEAMTRFGAPDEVELMEPVYRMVPVETCAAAHTAPAQTSAAPFDDPLLGLQWVYRNDGSLPGSTAGADLNVYPAWTVCGGSGEVIVAVADGGIDFTHPDLAANMWDDGAGHCGFNFCTNTYEISPSEHGTRVAGMVGAVNNNGIGICGIAGGDGTPGSGVKLMSCQIFDGAPDAHSASIEALMVWAADHGAVISQNSWNYVGLSDLSASGKAAIDYFIEYAGMDENGRQTGPMAGGIVIFAAGNGNTSTPQFPAAYDKVIAVGSLCPDFRKAVSSNYGEWVDLVAFGGESTGIDGCNSPFTTDLGGGYIYASGTSMACPQVSGLAALAASYYGSKGHGFTAEELRGLLIGSGRREIVERFNPGYEGAFGAGLIDGEYLFFHDAAPEPVTDADAVGRRYRIEAEWTVPADYLGRAVRDFDIYVGKEPFTDIAAEGLKRYSFSIDNAVAGGRACGTVGGLDPEERYRIAIVARSKYGTAAEACFVDVAMTGNSAPEETMPAEEIFIRDTDENVYLPLGERFADADSPDDMLNYFVRYSKGGVVECIVDGDRLRIRPLAAGSVECEIIAVDRDGAAATHTVRVVVASADPVADLYPNPFADRLNIRIPGAEGRFRVMLYDRNGYKALDTYVSIAPGETGNSGWIATQDIAPGNYRFVLDYYGTAIERTVVKR